MSEAKVLKFFCICRLQTKKIINSQQIPSLDIINVKQETEKILNRLQDIKFRPKERQKVNSQKFGSWYATMDDKGIVYMTLASNSYAERHAYGISQEAEKKLISMGEYGAEDDMSINYRSKDFIKELFKKYSNTVEFDKVQQAQSEVDKTKDQVQNLIVKTLDNHGNLKKVEDKSIQLNKNSQLFAKQSKELERILFWRKVKLNILIVVVVLGIIAFCVLPFIFETSALGILKGDDDKDNNNNDNNKNNNNDNNNDSNSNDNNGQTEITDGEENNTVVQISTNIYQKQVLNLRRLGGNIFIQNDVDWNQFR
ncbi:Longin-like domain [Pseudocohnilembus persalinus]|uniref:Longin-like domain n=1 Tax=Pseudocohnilembus persalinus TaxID=266149 RepID=A0A0V0QKN6_PSEPJ|nr:Longin-like domain [Pseudocohnilembus persalinus]|eukprot:KRX02873.1 Longin-like domain [Pseudocohnilembus persalinus]